MINDRTQRIEQNKKKSVTIQKKWYRRNKIALGWKKGEKYVRIKPKVSSKKRWGGDENVKKSQKVLNWTGEMLKKKVSSRAFYSLFKSPVWQIFKMQMLSSSPLRRDPSIVCWECIYSVANGGNKDCLSHTHAKKNRTKRRIKKMAKRK